MDSKESVRHGYENLGIEGYYKIHSEDYNNPHFLYIKRLVINYTNKNDIGHNILDMCCGSGEITTILNEVGEYNVEGLDPYTESAYVKNTGKECMKYSFKDIVCGALKNKRYDTVICSFAMHLCEESMLNMLLFQISLVTDRLIIITPHKRPEITNWFKLNCEMKYNKVKLRVYYKI